MTSALALNNLVQSVVLAAEDPLHHNYDYPILTIDGHIILTNHIVIMVLVAAFMVWVFSKGAKAIATGNTGTSHDYVAKGTWARVFEIICIFLWDDVCEPMLGSNTKKFLPFVWTIFFFILLNNIFGLIPVFDVTSMVFGPILNGSQTTEQVEAAHAPAAHEEAADASSSSASSGVVWFQDLNEPGVHSHFDGFGGTPTGNIAVTFALALIAAIVIIGSGVQSLGLRGFLQHLTMDAPIAIAPLIFVLEVVGLIVKPFALMVRLFANMTAGHALLAVLLGFCSMAWNGLAIVQIPGTEQWGHSAGGMFGALIICAASIIASFGITMLEVLVAFIQAFIFTFLTVVFISLYQHEDHGHDHELLGDEHEHGHGSMLDIETVPVG